ncbi:MAG: diguanylate cyclase domain-containing protein, partial [Acidimicrobiaceae bacterium]
MTNPTNDVDRTVRAVSIFVLATAVTLRVVLAVRANAVLQAQLIDSAQTDSLTNLPNRGLMIEHVAAALEGARFNGLSPTVLFIDVDRFKNINDSLGHSAGDDVLVSVAQRLRVALPDRCIVGRISGDEFVVLDAKSKNQSDAVLLADLVLESFHEPLALRQGDVFVSASIGVAVF